MLVLMMLNIPLVVHSQCTDIFKQGVALMEAKKYKSAIDYFQKAKKCDKNLAKQCDEKITECEEKIVPVPPRKPVISSKITLDKVSLEFGEEHTATKSVTVTCDVDWECSSNATDWCTVTKTSKNKLAISCSINETEQDRTAIVKVKNEKEEQNIKVVQKGKVAILNIIEPEYKFWKKGSPYFKIPLECNIEYLIDDEDWPEWLEVLEILPDKIIIKVDPINWLNAKVKIAGERTFFIKILSFDETKKDEVLIRQYDKKKPRSQEEDEE